MYIKFNTSLIIIAVLIISCKNQNDENRLPNDGQNEIVIEEIQEEIEEERAEGKIDMVQIVAQLQGKWKEVAYPYRTAEYVHSTAKFIEEGTQSKVKFEEFELTEDCQFDNNNIKNLKFGDIIISLPESKRCEKIYVSKDTLILSGYSTNTKADYKIVYLKVK